LASAQAIAAVDQQARHPFAQRAQRCGDVPVIVEIRGVVDAHA
jgi:hypothetical protein